MYFVQSDNALSKSFKAGNPGSHCNVFDKRVVVVGGGHDVMRSFVKGSMRMYFTKRDALDSN